MELKNITEQTVEVNLAYYVRMSVDNDDSIECGGSLYDEIVGITKDGQRAYGMYQSINEQTVLNKVFGLCNECGDNYLATGYTIDKFDHGFGKTYYVDVYGKLFPDEKAVIHHYSVRIYLASIPMDRLSIQ